MHQSLPTPIMSIRKQYHKRNRMVPTPIFNMESNNAIYGASCRTATDVSTVLYIGGSIFMQHIMTEPNIIVGVKKEW